mgnify:CR=1 FL=1
MNDFNFGIYLLEKGFAYSNYGEHQLYELTKEEVDYCINLQGDKMTANDSKTNDLKIDVPTPKNSKEADKFLKQFFS